MPLIKSVHTPNAVAAFSMTDIEREASELLEGARRRAQAIITQARQEAQRVHGKAVEQGKEEGRLAGHEEGYRDGLEAGQAAALEQVRPRVNELTDALEGILTAFDATRAQFDAVVADEVLRLSLALAQKVCKRAGEFDPEVCRANAQAALRLVMRSRDICLRCHPFDRTHIEDLLPQLGRRWPSLKHIDIVDDVTIARGGCQVTTSGGLVDADLQTQLDRIVIDLIPANA